MSLLEPCPLCPLSFHHSNNHLSAFALGNMKFKCAQLKEYQIVGKPLSKANEKTPIYKMRIFAPDEVRYFCTFS